MSFFASGWFTLFLGVALVAAVTLGFWLEFRRDARRPRPDTIFYPIGAFDPYVAPSHVRPVDRPVLFDWERDCEDMIGDDDDDDDDDDAADAYEGLLTAWEIMDGER